MVPSSDLERQLTLLDATMINVGTIIGSGIFIVPATIAAYVPASSMILLVWVVAGLISLCGALSIAELSAALPKAGGQYVYLKEAYGEMWGFLYGWSGFAVINTASVSAIAVTFASYLAYLFPMDSWQIKLTATLSIFFLTAINTYGVKLGAWVQDVLTMFKIAALAMIVVAGFSSSLGSVQNFRPWFSEIAFSEMVGPFGLALVAALWAYDGWIEISFIAGEVERPEKNLPLSIIFSILLMIVLYILINLAVLYVLPISKTRESLLVASDVAVIVGGAAGAIGVTIAIIFSTLGSSNGIILTSARIPYAMAREKTFFQFMGKVHPEFKTPHVALIIQGVWASALVLSGTYDQLITYIVFASFLFYGLSCGAVLILRKSQPDLPRTYRAWGYPVTPIIFILFSIGLVINTIREAPADAAIGAGIVLTGIPLYFYWKKNRGVTAESLS